MARFWPETVEYCDAVQTPAVAFADPELQAATVNVDALGRATLRPSFNSARPTERGRGQ
jgi:hypothetical protein